MLLTGADSDDAAFSALGTAVTLCVMCVLGVWGTPQTLLSIWDLIITQNMMRLRSGCLKKRRGVGAARSRQTSITVLWHFEALFSYRKSKREWLLAPFITVTDRGKGKHICLGFRVCADVLTSISIVLVLSIPAWVFAWYQFGGIAHHQ